MSLKMAAQSVTGTMNFVDICLTAEYGCLTDRMSILGQLATDFGRWLKREIATKGLPTGIFPYEQEGVVFP
jgi:hypothetical protein